MQSSCWQNVTTMKHLSRPLSALVLGKTTNRVNKQPAAGSLFLSQNGQLGHHNKIQNMAYRIHTAKFKSEGNVNFYNSTYPKFVHNQQMMSVDSADLYSLPCQSVCTRSWYWRLSCTNWIDTYEGLPWSHWQSDIK